MAPRKCTQARRAGEGARRGGHSSARPRLGGSREARGPSLQGRGVPPQRYGLGLSLRPFSSSAHSTWGPGRPATWGYASPGGPGRSAPGWTRPLRAFARPAAPTYPLPGPATPTSFWAPAPASSAFCARGVRRRPATGGTCAPQIRIQQTVPAPCPRGGDGYGCEERGPLCAGTCSGCATYEKQNIFTH